MAQKPIEQATKQELLDFARTYRGLDVHHASGKATIIGTLRASGFNGDMIDVADQAPRAVQEPDYDTTTGSHERPAGMGDRKMVIIYIPAQDKPGGDDPVFVQCNGRAMFIPRNEECPVPVEYVEILRNAVEWEYEVRSDGLGLLPPRSVPSYPFQTIA